MQNHLCPISSGFCVPEMIIKWVHFHCVIQEIIGLRFRDAGYTYRPNITYLTPELNVRPVLGERVQLSTSAFSSLPARQILFTWSVNAYLVYFSI